MVVCLQGRVKINDKAYGVSEIRGIRSVGREKTRHIPGDMASSWEMYFRAKAVEGAWNVVRMRLGSWEESWPTNRCHLKGLESVLQVLVETGGHTWAGEPRSTLEWV